MLIKIWELLRGYHKWTPVQARFQILKEEHGYRDKAGNERHFSLATGDRLVWTDLHGVAHHFDFLLPGDPDKPPLADGETIDLRYNPANPEQFYSRKLSEMKVRRFFAAAFTAIAVAAMTIGYVWIKEMFGCSR